MLFGTVLLSIHHIHDLSALFDPQASGGACAVILIPFSIQDITSAPGGHDVRFAESVLANYCEFVCF